MAVHWDMLNDVAEFALFLEGGASLLTKAKPHSGEPFKRQLTVAAACNGVMTDTQQDCQWAAYSYRGSENCLHEGSGRQHNCNAEEGETAGQARHLCITVRLSKGLGPLGQCSFTMLLSSACELRKPRTDRTAAAQQAAILSTR